MRRITIYLASGRVVEVVRHWYDAFWDGWFYRSYHLLDGRRIEIPGRQIEQRIWEDK